MLRNGIRKKREEVCSPIIAAEDSYNTNKPHKKTKWIDRKAYILERKPDYCGCREKGPMKGEKGYP
jgi:hypothetical protein